MRYAAVMLVVLVLLPGTMEADQGTLWPRLYEEVDWFHAAEVPSAEQDLLELAMSGKLAEWSETWIRKAIADAPSIDECLAKAKAERKPLFWYIPSVAGQHMILPNLLDRYVVLGPLSHPDVTGILNARFVNLKLPAGGELAKRFELEAPGFIEPGFLFLTPDGKVLHRVNRINTLNAHYVRSMLQQVLALPKAKGLGGDVETTPKALLNSFRDGTASGRNRLLDTCERWLHEGYDDVALDTLSEVWKLFGTLGNQPSFVAPDAAWSRAGYLLAIAHRRARRGDPALEMLSRAVELGPPDELHGTIGVETGLVHLRMGNDHFARKAFEGVIALRPNSARVAEARYWLGVAETMARDDRAALVSWLAGMSRNKDSIWGARCDACSAMGGDERRGETALMRAFLDPRWMPDEAYRLAEDTQWRRTKSDLADIRRRALEFLLRQQRQRGSFAGPRWGAGSNAEIDENMEVAITALCAEALDRWRDEHRGAKAALARAEDWLLGSPRVRRGDAVVWVYADGLRLRHFARRLSHLEGDKAKLARRRMATWIKNLEDHQDETGGPFKHYTYTSTFVTAAIKCCLHDAKDAGFDVKTTTFARASKVILGARDPRTGLFGYLLDKPEATRSMRGAAQRQPLCEWALFRSGQADTARADRAMGVYLETYPESAAVARKTNFHIPSLDHTAGYYFWHDFLFACECAKACVPHRKVTHLRKLLDLWCELPEIDGSFVDSGFSYGKAYGTAMALISLSLIEGGLPG